MPGAHSQCFGGVAAEIYRVNPSGKISENTRPASGCQRFLLRAATAYEYSLRETYGSITPFIGVRPDYADEIPGNRTLLDAVGIDALDQGNGG